jgi:hypothetical protein
MMGGRLKENAEQRVYIGSADVDVEYKIIGDE